MECAKILLNGRLVEATLDPITEVCLRTACDIHVVNVSAAPIVVSVRQTTGANADHLTLPLGGTLVVDVAAAATTTTTTIDVTLVFSALAPALNATEREFAQEVCDRLHRLRNPTGGSGTTTTTSTSTTSSTGATCMKHVVQSCATRAPAHACELISSSGHVNAFKGVAGETYCVAKKGSKPRALNAPCPRIAATAGIDVIARRASAGEAVWRQCAASFSTMMRHFQKAPASFKWEADAERRTIITTV